MAGMPGHRLVLLKASLPDEAPVGFVLGSPREQVRERPVLSRDDSPRRRLRGRRGLRPGREWRPLRQPGAPGTFADWTGARSGR